VAHSGWTSFRPHSREPAVLVSRILNPAPQTSRVQTTPAPRGRAWPTTVCPGVLLHQKFKEYKMPRN